MPFLKEFIINEKTKIKLWKVTLGELSPKELNKDDKKLFKLKKNNILREQRQTWTNHRKQTQHSIRTLTLK